MGGITIYRLRVLSVMKKNLMLKLLTGDLKKFARVRTARLARALRLVAILGTDQFSFISVAHKSSHQ